MDFSRIFGFIFPFMESVPSVRAIAGFILFFFLPGFAWTLVLFKQLNIIERIALSVGLSIAIVTLAILVAHILLGVRITGLNSLLIIIIIIIIPLAIYYLKRLISGSSSQQN
ncbi:DUF1616 domain-containing protein [Chloroflexota bacterium]